MDDKKLFETLINEIHQKLSMPNGTRSDELERFETKLYYGIVPKTYEALRTEYAAQQALETELTDEEEEIKTAYAESDSVCEEIRNDEAPEPTALYSKEDVIEEAQTVLNFIELSRNISENRKADALTESLRQQFDKAKKEGWPEKAVVFTEFRSTQNYILKALKSFGLDQDKDIAIFNGDSGDVEDRKKIVEDFKEHKKIFLTTEAGAEGLNLQFCNLILNYDLPWNPQRIEQRIGRCHRYGQKLDVVVVNFVNTRNSADVRVLELLQEKFNLFKGAFGASDEVLGAIESGQDFEQEILKIYLACRSEKEIKAAFDELREKFAPRIDQRLQEAKKTVLEVFDEDVQSKLKLTLDATRETLDDLGYKFKNVIEQVLGQRAKWLDDKLSFELIDSFDGTQPGRYSLNTRDSKCLPIRTHSGLGETILKRAATSSIDCGQLVFNLSSKSSPVAQVQQLKGKSGILTVAKLKAQSIGFEERVVFAGLDDSGQAIAQEVAEKLFRFTALTFPTQVGGTERAKLTDTLKTLVKHNESEIKATNQTIFESEIERLDKWAEDIKLSLELEIKALDREIRQKKVDVKKLQLLADKVAMQKEIKSLEARRNDRRRQLFDSQDQVEREKDQLLDKIEANLEPIVNLEELFTIRWKVA